MALVMQTKALNLILCMKNSYVIFFYCLRFFRIVNMLIFVMKRRIPRYYCISFVFHSLSFETTQYSVKRHETSVNFIWKTSSKTWHLQQNISHLCSYDESFKSGYNFGTDIKDGLYILGVFCVVNWWLLTFRRHCAPSKRL